MTQRDQRGRHLGRLDPSNSSNGECVSLFVKGGVEDEGEGGWGGEVDEGEGDGGAVGGFLFGDGDHVGGAGRGEVG